jgi:magnesium transporter
MGESRETEKGKKDQAINYTTDKVPVIPDSYTISDTSDFIKKNAGNFDTIDYIYVLNKKKGLTGVLSIRDLFKHSGKTLVKGVMEKNILTVSPDTPQVRVANMALKHKLKSVPIVKNGKFVGVILTSKIFSMINKDLHQHLLYTAGVHKGHLEYEDTMKVPLKVSLFHRIPWLVIGLVGIFFAAAFISYFESMIDTHIILAFFIPAVVYMSDALGTQLQTLFIRDMAVMGKDLKVHAYFSKQFMISIIIGLFIAGATFAVISVFWQQPYIAFVISIAMFATLMVSGFTSLLTTYLFKKLGQDPALGSGPFATIISDVSSVIIYFLIVSLLL